jgi:hypothetical protein
MAVITVMSGTVAVSVVVVPVVSRWIRETLSVMLSVIVVGE